MLRFIAVLGLLVLLACSTEPVIPPSPTVSFSADVSPILISNCARSGCHLGNSREIPPVTTFDQVSKLVTPGDAKASELYKVITRLFGETAMPPQGPLSEDQIRVVYVWIMQGAPNN